MLKGINYLYNRVVITTLKRILPALEQSCRAYKKFVLWQKVKLSKVGWPIRLIYTIWLKKAPVAKTSCIQIFRFFDYFFIVCSYSQSTAISSFFVRLIWRVKLFFFNEYCFENRWSEPLSNFLHLRRVSPLLLV